jgi:ribonuclease HIII
MNRPACFVATIDPALADKLREDLIEQGFDISTPAYTLLSAQKKGVSCTLYQSGKLTVQGRDKDDFITFYLEPEILKSFSYMHPETLVDLKPHIGIDEAGKGDFFGPLCIAGVHAGENEIREMLSLGVRDSKNISDQTIVILSRKIKERCPHSIVRISPVKYNELYTKFHNLNRLLAWGHATAIAELFQKTGCHDVLIDQFASEHLVKNALSQKKIPINLEQRHKAESDPVVAAASILARAAFLEGLEKLGAQFSVLLPKGASQKVIDTGRALVEKYGEQILAEVAKLHFKTREDILSSPR